MAVVLVLSNTFSFRSCTGRVPIGFDNKVVKCAGQTAFSLNSPAFTLSVEKITFESDEGFITYKFPLIWGLSLPLKMQAGSNAKITLCPISANADGIKYICQEKPVSELANVLKPGDIVVSAIVDPNFLSPKDNFRVRCGQIQGDFLSRVKKGGSILPYLSVFRKGTCTPSVGKILYKNP